MPQDDYVKGTVPKPLAKVNDCLHPDNHHVQQNLNVDSPFTINDQVLIRINKEDIEKNDTDVELAEQTPAGIHQDGSEITTVTLINR